MITSREAAKEDPCLHCEGDSAEHVEIHGDPLGAARGAIFGCIIGPLLFLLLVAVGYGIYRFVR